MLSQLPLTLKYEKFLTCTIFHFPHYFFFIIVGAKSYFVCTQCIGRYHWYGYMWNAWRILYRLRFKPHVVVTFICYLYYEIDCHEKIYFSLFFSFYLNDYVEEVEQMCGTYRCDMGWRWNKKSSYLRSLTKLEQEYELVYHTLNKNIDKWFNINLEGRIEEIGIRSPRRRPVGPRVTSIFRFFFLRGYELVYNTVLRPKNNSDPGLHDSLVYCKAFYKIFLLSFVT